MACHHNPLTRKRQPVEWQEADGLLRANRQLTTRRMRPNYDPTIAVPFIDICMHEQAAQVRHTTSLNYEFGILIAERGNIPIKSYRNIERTPINVIQRPISNISQVSFFADKFTEWRYKLKIVSMQLRSDINIRLY